MQAVPSLTYVAEEVARLRMALVMMAGENMPVSDLPELEIRKLLVSAGGSTVARKRFGALSRSLDWCQDSKHIRIGPP